MKDIRIEDFKVTGPVSIGSLPTKIDLKASEEEIKKALKEASKELAELQNTLYAHSKYAVLACFQGMDTSGKDSLIREVFKEFNVRGVVCHSFKTPTERELKHDYLWRHACALPERGKYAIFNRTHYENVLVTRVHPEYILKENLPDIETVEDIDESFWENRFMQINNFEDHIAANGTIIFKFFLNLSKEEQKHRLLRRLRKKDKNWKFSPGDLKERELWDSYMNCYEKVLNKTSKEHAPWYILPADDKPTARLLAARILLEVMSSYEDITEPEMPEEQKKLIPVYKKKLENE